MPPLEGVRHGCAASGEHYQGRDDIWLVTLPPRSRVAGVFTRSAVPAAPVVWSRRRGSGGFARALLVNAGNANACTGRVGEATALACAKAVARRVGCAAEEVMLASTGVIGEVPKRAALLDGIEQAWGNCGGGGGGRRWRQAAQAIMTTDAFPKGACRRVRVEGKEIEVVGIAKGAGMIAPNMATMLAFVFVDAALSAAEMKRLVRGGARDGFNRISVDGDCSTNDALFLFATGVKGGVRSAAGRARVGAAVREVCAELARQIVVDGEGASKFVTVAVGGAVSKASARRVGFAIANSPLVKTALAGEDANWGRIAMAVGKSGERMSLARLGISLGGVVVARSGAAVALSPAGVARLARHMRGRDILISVGLGVGSHSDEVWGCDLTHQYVAINADYRS